MMSTYATQYNRPGTLLYQANEANSKFTKVLKKFNTAHRTARQEYYSRLHNDLMYQWEQETENDNRNRTAARYILLAQYTYICSISFISTEDCKWPISELINSLLSADGYLANLVTTYLINYLNTRFYHNIPGDIRNLARYLNINNRDTNMRNLHRNIKKITYLHNRKHGCGISLLDIATMYNYLSDSKLSLLELVSEQSFTMLSNYVNSCGPSIAQAENIEYDLETNNIQVDDADFYDYMPANQVDSSDEDVAVSSPIEVLAVQSIEEELPHVMEPVSDNQAIQGDMDDFTVIKKGKKGAR